MNEQSAITNNQDRVLLKAELFAKEVYLTISSFLRYEMCGLSSQLRRTALSVPLNVVEGYTRQSYKVEAHFLTAAYASLQESKFSIKFAMRQKYLSVEAAQRLTKLGDEVARLIWSKSQTLRQKNGPPYG